MSVASIGWILGLLTVSAVFFLLRNVRHRQALFALCSFFFLASQSLDAYAWALLAAFLSSGYLVGKTLSRRPNGVVLVTYLCVLVGIFVFIKQYAVLTSVLPATFFERKIVLVGLSYMLFRQIHFVVDALQGQIEQLTLWNYLNYQLNLFGLQAGPIQRYQEFSKYWTRLEPLLNDWYDILRAYLRLFWGVIQVLGLSTLCLWAYTTVLHSYLTRATGWRTGGEFLLVLYLFPAYLYFNFSGYCDIVIAAAGLLGVRMPENFNKPFLSRNIGELWTRWHRTLGLWIRDYLFTPLFKRSVERWPKFIIPSTFISYLLAFSVAGLWHGSTWNFLVFGLLNGIGIGCAKAWEMFLVRRQGRAGLKAYLRSPQLKAVAILVTVHYFCFTLIFWAHDMTESVAILKRLANAF
jgi:alginate O-acetyltransferase complex protein AlgI